MNLKKFILTSLLVFLAFSLSAFSQTKVATDPSRIGVGARPLGMGKGYVGLADDLSSIFINPAGLSNVSDWQLTSMSGKFINEYDYLNAGFVHPSPYGSFGVGYVGGGISFTAPVGTTESLDGVRIIPSSTEGVSYSFNNSVTLLSWGSELGELRKIYDWEYFDRISLGANFKLFSLILSGPGINGGGASGTELDLGVLVRPAPGVRAGAVLQNALPYTMGGKIIWDNGTEETLPSTLKLGMSLQLVGSEGVFGQFGKHEARVNVDRDFFPGRGNLPQLLHMGVEWSPVPILDLRFGIDQETVGTGVAGVLEATDNLTAGVGLYFGGFRFDYAYHQYSELAANDTHYFSLSYGVGKAEEPVAAPTVDPFKVTPAGGSILYTENVALIGRVFWRSIDRVSVNDKAMVLANHRFEGDFPLVLGKNSFRVEGYGSGDRLVADSSIRYLRLVAFKDVSLDFWAAVPISLLATENVISGYPDGTFRPEGNITRAEMCTLLMKTKEPKNEKAEESGFEDVAVDHWAAGYIAQAVETGAVKGYPDGTFRPNGNITRAEGVTILARFADLPESRLMEVPFPDVPGRHWAVKYVAAAREAGILKYLEGRSFEPDRDLTRAEVAEMLSRTGAVGEKVDGILNWTQGQ